MNFPIVRHDQRYEYVLNKRYVDDRIVLDIGCGENAFGTSILSARAKMVIGIDPALQPDENGIIWCRSTNRTRPQNVRFVRDRVETMRASGPTDNSVAVCMEVFEHVLDPIAFTKHVATLAKWAFYTTPLAKRTGRTRNPEHVAEYTKRHFINALLESYNVLDYNCQLSDLSIVGRSKPAGDSLDACHVVQMAWCERR